MRKNPLPLTMRQTRQCFVVEAVFRTKRLSRWSRLRLWKPASKRKGWHRIDFAHGTSKRTYDAREKMSHWWTKYAIDRDGDWYLVECPKCHDQLVHWVESKRVFSCGCCDTRFRVYTEDGVRKLRDHRRGNVPFPAVFVTDDNGTAHLGLHADAPWWWGKRDIYRDLRADGKDGHGHKRYEVLPPEPQTAGECCAEVAR